MRRFVSASSLPAFAAAALSLLLSLSFLGCGEDPPAESATGAAPAPAAAPAPPEASPPSPAPAAPPAEGGGDFGMISSRGQQVAVRPAPAAGARGTSGSGIAFTFPESWREEQPSSSMRMAQASIPGPGGDGQLTVFFFGVGGGGGVEANLQRWVGQVQVNPGEQPLRDAFDSGPFKIHYVEVGGTIRASNMGTGPATDQPGQRLLGAVVEGPGGPWFFKATGPEATMNAERAAFKKMLQELKPEV